MTQIFKDYIFEVSTMLYNVMNRKILLEDTKLRKMVNARCSGIERHIENKYWS